MQRHQRFELCNELSVRTRGEIGLDPQHQRLRASLLQRPAPVGEASLCRDVAQRFPPDQTESLAEQLPSLTRVRSSPLHERVEPRTVELDPIGAQRIPGRLALDEVAGQFAQLRQVHVERRYRAARRTIAPKLVDQPVARHRDPAPEQQQREQRSLPTTRHRELASAALEHERTEHPKTNCAAGHRDRG
jgi:hypothetical protein